MRLYKYRSLSNFELLADILVHHRLFCCPYSQLNDPFEGQFVVERDIEIENPDNTSEFEPPWCVIGRDELPSNDDHLNNFFIGNKVPQICSLSESADNMLLWAHYGESHKGVAIELELDCKEDSISQVVYAPMLTRISEAVLDFPPMDDGYWILAQKTSHWEYEREWRIFHDQKYFDITNKIKSIVLGCRFPEEKVEVIRRLAPGIQLRRAEIVHQQSSIRIIDYA